MFTKLKNVHVFQIMFTLFKKNYKFSTAAVRLAAIGRNERRIGAPKYIDMLNISVK